MKKVFENVDIMMKNFAGGWFSTQFFPELGPKLEHIFPEVEPKILKIQKLTPLAFY